jgi:hypothetical protein
MQWWNFVRPTKSNEWTCHKCGTELHEGVEVGFEVSTADEPKAVPSDQTFVILSVFMPVGVRVKNDSLVVVVGDRPRFQMPVKLLAGQRYDVLSPIVVPPRSEIKLSAFASSKIGERNTRVADRGYAVFLCGLLRRDVG